MRAATRRGWRTSTRPSDFSEKNTGRRVDFPDPVGALITKRRVPPSYAVNI